MAAKKPKRKPGVWEDQTRLDYVESKLKVGLQRADVAAGLGFTADEFQGFIDAGCAPRAPEDLRLLADLVIQAELEHKESLLVRITSGKNWMGALALLQTRYKTSWGKDAKPPAEGISANVVDWDAELGAMLDDEYSPLVHVLHEKGFTRIADPPDQDEDEAQEQNA